MEHLFEAILKIARKDPEGFTVDLTTLKKVAAGISVAYLETQESFGEDGLRRVINHAKGHDNIVGGWLNDDDGEFYFDSVRIFTDLEEAIRFGRENKQIAIFDLTNLKLIKL
ncbi:MAG: hypothetical protein ACRCZM_02185 [Bacteroidales bacterium]